MGKYNLKFGSLHNGNSHRARLRFLMDDDKYLLSAFVGISAGHEELTATGIAGASQRL